MPSFACAKLIYSINKLTLLTQRQTNPGVQGHIDTWKTDYNECTTTACNG